VGSSVTRVTSSSWSGLSVVVRETVGLAVLERTDASGPVGLISLHCQ